MGLVVSFYLQQWRLTSHARLFWVISRHFPSSIGLFANSGVFLVGEFTVGARTVYIAYRTSLVGESIDLGSGTMLGLKLGLQPCTLSYLHLSHSAYLNEQQQRFVLR